MRKVTEQTVSAFLNHRPCTVDNTCSTGYSLILHGNTIANHVDDGIDVTLAGWNTPTTRERVNAVLQLAGFSERFCQRDFVAHLVKDGKATAINPDEWFRFRWND